MHRALSILPCLLALLLLMPAAHADRFEQHDDLEIHFNAMPTTRLSPEISEARSIPRSRLQGMVLISVLRDGESVPARLRGHVVDDAGDEREIQFREVREGDFVNTIGTFRINDLERLRFELEVRPRDGDARYPIRFSERFHVD